MFNAPHCQCCGKKEAKNGEGCNNPDCKEYYKLKESFVKRCQKHRTSRERLMKAYMGYSRFLGSEEGAVLIFAHNAKEAKRLAWKANAFDDEYIDGEVRWLKNEPYLFKQMRFNIPHVIANPKICGKCKMWGTGEIGEDGICESCREDD